MAATPPPDPEAILRQLYDAGTDQFFNSMLDAAAELVLDAPRNPGHDQRMDLWLQLARHIVGPMVAGLDPERIVACFAHTLLCLVEERAHNRL